MADGLKHSSTSGEKREQLTLHQTLHGYSDGHRLLASSLALPPDSARTLARLSDISGPTFIRGFEEYLTAYPLAKDGLFAFAKTWAAPEMRRPGCVWTHTLILTESLVSQLQSLDELIGLFSRPSKMSPEGYATPLPFTRASSRKLINKLDAVPAQERERALLKIFWHREAAVFEARDAEQWRELFLAIWSLAWPSLRMTLSFCTGALSARNIGRRPFDLQAAPPSAFRDIVREIGSPSSASPKSGSGAPSWVRLAAQNLYAASPLAAFLRKAAGMDDDRRCFAPLAQFFELFTTHSSDDKSFASALISAVAEHFPSSEDGVRLKIALLGPPSLRKLTTHVQEGQLLEELAESRHHTALNADDLEGRSRGQELWQTQPSEARRLLLALFRAPINPIGEEILRGLIFGISLGEAQKLGESEPDMLAAAIRVRPSLAANPLIWQQSQFRQHNLFSAVAESEISLSPDLAANLTSALLEAGADSVAQQALEYFGGRGVRSALSWIDEHKAPISREWVKALEKQPEAVCQWFSSQQRISFRTAVFVSTLLDPRDPKVIGHGSEKWLSVIDDVKSSGEDSDTLRLHAFLLTLAFENPLPHAEKLAAFSFATIHRAVEDSRIDYDSWQMLEHTLPDVGWSLWWDKCERLRRGLVAAFVRYSWPPRQFVCCASDSALLKALKKSARKVEGGRELLARIIKDQRGSRSR